MTMEEVDYAEERIYEYEYIARCWEINIKQEDEDDDGE